MPEPEIEDPPDSEFELAAQLAAKTLEHAHRYRSPLLPHAYEVWFTYVVGTDEKLRERIDRELVEARVVDLDKIEEIYEEHFRGKALSSGMSAIGHELESGLTDAITILRDGLGESRRFLGSLRKAQDRIASLTGRKNTGRAVGELVALAHAHAAHTEALDSELAKVRAQVVELQTELQGMRDTAYLDHLTQIPNRRRMDEVLEAEIALARDSGQSLSFALLDIDHFKRLNDTFGHDVGDAVLKHVAGLLRRNTKGQDTPARYGGEEFAIILPRTSLPDAKLVLEKIRRRLSEINFIRSGNRLPVGQVSVSIGLSELLPGDSAETLIHRADALLYRAKRHGRNRLEAGL